MSLSYNTTRPTPLVAVTACKMPIDAVAHETVRCQYINAVLRYADLNPLILPTGSNDFAHNGLLSRIDGILLTGSLSNIAPARYAASGNACRADPARDASTLNLIPLAVDRGIPLLGICRGLQEINVAYGGDLYQNLADEAGMLTHHEDESLPRDAQYLPAHTLELAPNSQLQRWLGRTSITVNSLHKQGVKRLGSQLFAEAIAADGLIEALTVIAAPAFVLGVQWHPEWHVQSDPISQEIFQRFGQACRHHMNHRQDML